MVVGYGHRFALSLHELEHSSLAEHILQYHAVRAHIQVALSGYHLLILRVVEVSEQHLVGECERPVESPSHDFKSLLDSLIDFRRYFRRGFNSHHIDAALPISTS